MSEEKEVMETTNEELETVVEETEVEETEENEVTADETIVIKKQNPFVQVLKAVFIDEIIVALSSVVLLYVLDAILKLAGFYIAEKVSMLFIIFVLISILYPIIMENSKYKNTFGKKLSNLKLTEIEK